ncbi:hypothetical protein EYF80_042185 [Liparis tanakae]|uniref:Uncharacterized protein n=1 Tax=Liparis tanakae TaxID=230148 RepID=A0A4Z2G4C1_9TELE|nr:hypothetical protein EYF80_042185 [Liparis tanakae]
MAPPVHQGSGWMYQSAHPNETLVWSLSDSTPRRKEGGGALLEEPIVLVVQVNESHTKAAGQ